MKLDIKSAVFMVLLASSVAMAEHGVFIGVDLGVINSKSAITSQATELGFNTIVMPKNSGNLANNAFEGALKAGYHFDSTHRIYLLYALNSAEAKKNPKVILGGLQAKLHLKKTSKLMLGYDYTPMLSNMIRAVAGIYAGKASRDVSLRIFDSDHPRIGSVTTKSSGNLFGLKLGAIYELAHNGEFELGITYESAKMGDKALIDEQKHHTITFSEQKQSNITLHVGYVYKF